MDSKPALPFKPGDKVLCLRSFKCIITDKTEFMVGQIYTVKEVVGNNVMVEFDDMGNTDNGLQSHNFQLVQ